MTVAAQGWVYLRGSFQADVGALHQADVMFVGRSAKLARSLVAAAGLFGAQDNSLCLSRGFVSSGSVPC